MNPRRWLLGLGLIAALIVTGVSAMRLAHDASRLRAGDDETIRPWMNVPYIAHAYDVPASILFKAVGLPEDARDGRPIMRIAREQQRSVGSVVADLNAAIGAYRAPSPLPTPPPAPAMPPIDESGAP